MDLLVLGTIVTLDPARPLCDALLARDGRVVRAGDERTVRREAATGATVLDARGALVVPGLRDGHAHLSSLGRLRASLDLRDAPSAEAIAARVKVAATDGEGWIEGRGWDQTRFDPPVLPDGALLDSAAPGRPVFLKRVDGHAAWINRAAATAAGLTDASADPEGGRLLRRADGRLAGVVLDRAAELVERSQPPPTPATRKAWLAAAAAEARALGLVEVHDMGVDLTTLAALRELDAEGALDVRVRAWVDDLAVLEAADGPLAGPPPPRAAPGHVEVGGIKLYADGALGSSGAALEADYTDEPGNRGLLLTPPERLFELCRRAARAGWPVAVHAIGDRALRIALDAAEQAAAAASVPARALRFRIEHAQMVPPAQLERMALLGAVAGVQPYHAVADQRWVERRLGPARLATAYPLRRLARAGVRVVGGSDFPVEAPNPLLGLAAAITRTDEQGRPPGGFLPGEALEPFEALALYTAAPAWAAFAEHHRGRLLPGLACDLTILKGDPRALLAGEGHAWRASRALGTVVDGVVAGGLSGTLASIVASGVASVVTSGGVDRRPSGPKTR
jgi:predicted amidohydrolase YtcJ